MFLSEFFLTKREGENFCFCHNIVHAVKRKMGIIMRQRRKKERTRERLTELPKEQGTQTGKVRVLFSFCVFNGLRKVLSCRPDFLGLIEGERRRQKK